MVWVQGVFIPNMIHDLTTRRVLTMEWVDGVRLRSAGEDSSSGRALNPEDMRLVGVGFLSPASHRRMLDVPCAKQLPTSASFLARGPPS